MDIAYTFPCRPGYLYLNITNRCPNSCLFCIKHKGDKFFGYELQIKKEPSVAEILDAIRSFPNFKLIKEIVFCGIGEPLLRYDVVIELCHEIKYLYNSRIKIKVDTCGLYYVFQRRVDFASIVDVICVSLNAESKDKYYALCRPVIENAYDVLMDFLKDLKQYTEKLNTDKPDIFLSVVDLSEYEYLPDIAKNLYTEESMPVPDAEVCKRLANNFGWPLIRKRLFRDSHEIRWCESNFENICSEGKFLTSCVNCSFRH